MHGKEGILKLDITSGNAGEFHKALHLCVHGLFAEHYFNPAGLHDCFFHAERPSVVRLLRVFFHRSPGALYGEAVSEVLRSAAALRKHLSKGKANRVGFPCFKAFRGVGDGCGRIPQHRALSLGRGCEKALRGHAHGAFGKVYPQGRIFRDNTARICLNVRGKVCGAGRLCLFAAVPAAAKAENYNHPGQKQCTVCRPSHGAWR